ncbi:MAG: ADP-ribosylglycohydrolase family protein [Anaerolineae bacterium]|nr:ADP-ribosylglycohydrolase family protein [Anaerolineae bacterium]
MRLSPAVIAQRVHKEIDARALQGYVTNGLMARWEAAQGIESALLALHDELKRLPVRDGWSYYEPSDLDGIRSLRPASAALPDLYLAEEEIRNKIHGAWLGRVAGCILGKPLEMHFTADEVQAYLEGANAYPLRDFVPSQSHDPRRLRRDCVPSMRDYVQYAQEDDDLNYMCLAVKLLEQHGPDFTTLDVGMNWLNSIPFLWTWGPEHVVYLNLAVAVADHQPEHVDLEAIAGYLNPGVEWIGAQIRADVYGYVCSGLPERAAEFAWRDAYLTHRMNGIYGAMWVAAMNAAAFTLLDAEAIIHAGLAQIPAKSRFAEAILRTLDWCSQDKDWRVTARRIHEQYQQYTMGGAISNACCVVVALMEGLAGAALPDGGAFERTITTAVQCGYDTDCNAATAGSIAGLMLGAGLLPDKWVAPLHDTLRTCVAEFGQVSIRDMARRTYELGRVVRYAKGNA